SRSRRRTNQLPRLRSPLKRQSHRLSGYRRALDGDGRLQVDAGLRGRGVDGRRAGGEMIEPGARLVAEWSPEVANGPVTRRVAAEKRHVHLMVRDVGV